MKARSFLLVLGLAMYVAAGPAQEREHRALSPDTQSGRRNVADAALIVVHADVPLYPSLAMAAHESGTVRVRVSVKAGSVPTADTESAAPPVLLHAAKENVRTWRFTPDVYGMFDATYIYELAEAAGVFPENPHIDMQLPHLVRITAKPVKAMPMHGQ